MDRNDLAKLKRAELQKLSKDEGLKANLKTDALVEALEAHYAANPSRHPSAQVKTSRAPSSLSVSTSRVPSRATSQTQLRKPTQPFKPANASTAAAKEPKLVATAAVISQTENTAGSSTSAVVPARAPRKAKETQLRLGVGRPKLVGGSGARATNPKPVRSVTGARTVTATRNTSSTAATRRKTPAGAQATTAAKLVQEASTTDLGSGSKARDETTQSEPLPSISEDDPGAGAKPSVSGEQGDAEDMHAIPAAPLPSQVVPVHSTAQVSSASISSISMQSAFPTHTSSPNRPSRLIVALEQTVELLRARVTTLEEQNAGLLQRMAALEAARSERMASYTFMATDPASPAMSIPQSARIRSDASSFVPQSARVRSDASSIMAISRPQSTVGGRRVSGMPSPRRSSLAVQGGWTAGQAIAEEDEHSMDNMLPQFDIPIHSTGTSTPSMRPTSVAPSPIPPPIPELQPSDLTTPSAATQPIPPAVPAVPTKKMRAHVPVQKAVPPQPPVPLWRQGIFRDPFPPPNPTALGKHPRESIGTAPNSPSITDAVTSTPVDRPPRKKARLGKGLPSARRSLPQAEPATTPGGFPLLSATMAEFAERRAAGLPGPPPRTSNIQPGMFPFVDEPSPASSSIAPFADRTSLSGTPSSTAPVEDHRSISMNEADEPVSSINKSFNGMPPPRTPPPNAANAPPPPETPLTAAYGPVLAALFRGPNKEDLPEEERSPEKKTVYGTECRGNTRFGEYGWDWRY